jgi:hypothetical protein
MGNINGIFKSKYHPKARFIGVREKSLKSHYGMVDIAKAIGHLVSKV